MHRNRAQSGLDHGIGEILLVVQLVDLAGFVPLVLLLYGIWYDTYIWRSCMALPIQVISVCA